MTKPRTPDTFADAMTTVRIALGVAETARIATEAAGRDYSESAIYTWGNKDAGTLPSLELALVFDRAYRLAGNDGAPFRDAFAQQLESSVKAADACRRSLVTESAAFVREAAEATEALFLATQPGASPREIHRALVEAQQVERAARPLRRRLTSFLRPAIRASAGKSGGTHQ